MKISAQVAGPMIRTEVGDQIGRVAAEPSSLSMPSRLLFSPGQLVRGQVLVAQADGRLLLEIDGQTVEARSEILLKPGSSFWLEVRQSDPLLLRLAEHKGVAQDFLRQFGADSTAMGRGLRFLLAMASEAGGSDPLSEAEFLQNFSQAALDGEADPGRVLRQVSMLARAIGSDDDAPTGILAEKVLALAAKLASDKAPGSVVLERLAHLLDLQNELNSLPSSPQQPQVQLFPCFFAMGAGWGQWLISLDQEAEEGSADNREYTISFFLEMSQLGEVQVQVRGQAESLWGEFIFASEEARRHLEEQLPELVALLERLGYRPVSLSCRMGKTGLLETMKKALEQATGLDPVRLVDLKA